MSVLKRSRSGTKAMMYVLKHCRELGMEHDVCTKRCRDAAKAHDFCAGTLWRENVLVKL